MKHPMILSKQEEAMSKYALCVPLEAKPGKEKEVADFPRSAVPLVNAEAGTISWFAIQEGPSKARLCENFANAWNMMLASGISSVAVKGGHAKCPDLINPPSCIERTERPGLFS
jgi:hypothetical protein